MRKKNLFKYGSFVAIMALVVLFAQLTASVPVQASAALQTTPEVTVIVPTVVIPNTGGDNTQVINIFSSWIFWIILGVVLLALLVALLARPTHIHHDDEL